MLEYLEKNHYTLAVCSRTKNLKNNKNGDNMATKSNLLKKGGGHSMAAGLTIESEKIEELEKFFEKQLTNKII